MVKIATANDQLLKYLFEISKENGFTVGLMLGQSCSGKDLVIHFAKTPPIEEKEDENWQKISDINDSLIADHAKQVTRMLPGGMYVLGMFLITPEDVLSNFTPKLKSILNVMHNNLNSNKYLFGTNSNETLVLNFCNKNKFSCKSYNILTDKIEIVNFKFHTIEQKFISIESALKMDHLRYLKHDKSDWPLQKHVQAIVDELNQTLESAVYLFNGEIKDDNETFDFAEKKPKSPHTIHQNSQSIQLTILQSKLPADLEQHSTLTIETAGQLRLVGNVACKLLIQPKFTASEAIKFIKEDIMRSLASRLEMHWDSLTEEENSDDVNCVHEPPRRVSIRLPNSDVTLSDYLFPGEGAEDARNSLEELLDIKITGQLQVEDIEGQADTSQYYHSPEMEIVGAEILPSNSNRVLLVGIISAIFVLIISLLLHSYNNQ